MKKEPVPNSAYFNNYKFKSNENHLKHERIIIHYDYVINVVGFFTVLCQFR